MIVFIIVFSFFITILYYRVKHSCRSVNIYAKKTHVASVFRQSSLFNKSLNQFDYIFYVNILNKSLTYFLVSNISGAKDKESLMMVKLRRLFLQEPDKMKELKLLLRHHLPSEILQPEKEFPDIFDALTFQSKIELGEYSFLCDIFSEICFEAEKITREYQAIIINLLGEQQFLRILSDNLTLLTSYIFKLIGFICKLYNMFMILFPTTKNIVKESNTIHMRITDGRLSAIPILNVA